jgi:hypothetical protein
VIAVGRLSAGRGQPTVRICRRADAEKEAATEEMTDQSVGGAAVTARESARYERKKGSKMIRTIKAVTAVAAAAAALVIAVPGSAMATGNGCNQGDGLECTTVTGPGLKITSITGSWFNNSSSKQTVYLVAYGPDGYITKTGYYTVAVGSSTGAHTWHNPNPNANMTAGDYCTEAYSSTGPALISDCIEVHT